MTELEQLRLLHPGWRDVLEVTVVAYALLLEVLLLVIKVGSLDVLTRGRDHMIQGGDPVASVVPSVNKEMDGVLRREKARAETLLKQ